MAGVTAHGATFSFLTFSGKLLGISVEMPAAEVTNMASVSDLKESLMLVPTGAWAGGTITIDFLAYSADPQSFVRRVGPLTFSSSGFTISRRVICESASVSAQTGELVRGSLRFLMTDYQGA